MASFCRKSVIMSRVGGYSCQKIRLVPPTRRSQSISASLIFLDRKLQRRQSCRTVSLFMSLSGLLEYFSSPGNGRQVILPQAKSRPKTLLGGSCKPICLQQRESPSLNMTMTAVCRRSLSACLRPFPIAHQRSRS